MTDNLNCNIEVSETQDTLVELNDEALQSIAGGCTSTCGGGGRTTISTSCVSPGVQCP